MFNNFLKNIKLQNKSQNKDKFSITFFKIKKSKTLLTIQLIYLLENLKNEIRKISVFDLFQ